MQRELSIVLYRSLLRQCRSLRAAMRPGHVVLVGECVNRFSNKMAPALKPVIKDNGPLPLSGLVRRAFRQPAAPEQDGLTCARLPLIITIGLPLPAPRTLRVPHGLSPDDTAFNALRGLNQIAEYVRLNNEMYDSLEHLSDREAPDQPSMSSVARAILRDAKCLSSAKA
jgi:hypothetical protein